MKNTYREGGYEFDDYAPKKGKNIFGDKQIKIVRHAGDLNKVDLEDGTVVYRSKSIDMGVDLGGKIPCSPMDNHFIYKHRYGDRGWTLWCTCGSPGAIVGYDGYSKDASAQGAMIVCLQHANTNVHSDGSS